MAKWQSLSWLFEPNKDPLKFRNLIVVKPIDWISNYCRQYVRGKLRRLIWIRIWKRIAKGIKTRNSVSISEARSL